MKHVTFDLENLESEEESHVPVGSHQPRVLHSEDPQANSSTSLILPKPAEFRNIHSKNTDEAEAGRNGQSCGNCKRHFRLYVAITMFLIIGTIATCVGASLVASRRSCPSR